MMDEYMESGQATPGQIWILEQIEKTWQTQKHVQLSMMPTVTIIMIPGTGYPCTTSDLAGLQHQGYITHWEVTHSRYEPSTLRVMWSVRTLIELQEKGFIG